MPRSTVALATMAVCALLPATAGAITYTSSTTVTNRDFGTEQVVVDGQNKTGSSAVVVTLDNVTFGAFNATGQQYEGRLSVVRGGKAIVKNSKFGPGGCSDGIQVSGGGGNWGILDATNNEFTGITQFVNGVKCGPHVDTVQMYGARITNFSDNYIHDGTTGVEGYNWNGQIDVFKNNVIVGMEYHDDLLISANTGGQFTHNVIAGNSFEVNQSSGNTIRDNVIDDLQQVNGSSGNTVDHNLTSSQVQFAGGTGRCAYATKAPKGTASDGTDIGLNDCGGTTPPPDPPPANHTPTAAYTYAPPSPTVNQQVQFDATTATCDDAPCTYTWEDDGPDGPGGQQWPLGTGKTMAFTFQGAGDKHVRLTVKDTDGDTDATVKTVTVTDIPTPPAPAPVCDQACVDSYNAQITDLKAQLAAMTDSRDSVQTIADAYKARAETAEALVAHIHDETAP